MPANTEVRYDTMSVKTLRGTEKNSIAKWESQGWEFVSQNTGALRTELFFRRSKEKTSWKPIAILGGVLAALAIFITIMAITTGGDADKQPESEPAATPAASAPAAKPSKTPSAEPSPTPSESAMTPPAAQGPLTIENNADLAALLIGSDSGPSVEAFAQKYAGQLIEFDGSIGAMNNHEGYNTRYDILITYGDYSRDPLQRRPQLSDSRRQHHERSEADRQRTRHDRCWCQRARHRPSRFVQGSAVPAGAGLDTSALIAFRPVTKH